MGTTFHGPSPWPHITRAIRTRGSRRAAIAHLGQDAPTLLPLRGGDVLVVNASRAAVRAHLTSPVALAYYRDAGVRVLSSPDLHANVIATDRWAVIGSANASHSSTIAVEGAVITDDPDLVASVRGFIDGIEEVTEVDQVFLDDAVAQWQIGRAVPIPGVSGRGQADPGFLPAKIDRMFLRHIIEFELGPAEQHAWAAQARHRRAPAGPASKYQLEWFHHDKTDSRLRRGDVLVFISADHAWLHPPTVVDSEAIAIPRSRRAIGHLLRSRTDLDPIPVPVAEQILSDLGHPNPGLRADHRIASPSLRAAVLGLWNL